MNPFRPNPLTTLPTLLIALTLTLFLSACGSDDTEPDCNTDNVTYSATVAPVMAAHCNGCHSGPSASAGINTSTHAGLTAAAANGRLVGSLKHQSGFSAMPQGGSKLAECTIRQIEAWVNNGAPNN